VWNFSQYSDNQHYITNTVEKEGQRGTGRGERGGRRGGRGEGRGDEGGRGEGRGDEGRGERG